MSARYARCRRCGVMQLINKSGILRKHNKKYTNALYNSWLMPCEGSNQKPEDVQTFLEEKKDMIP